MHFLNVQGITVEHNIVHGTRADGIHIQRGSTDFRVAFNRIYDVGDDAIGLVSHAFPTYGYVKQGNVIGNVIGAQRAGFPGSGVALIGVIGVAVVGNIIDGTALSAVRATNFAGAPGEGWCIGGDIIIANNVITNAGTYTGTVPGVLRDGISIYNQRKVKVFGNIVDKAYNRGIAVSQSVIDIAIENNQVGRSGSRAITLEPAEQTGDALQLWTEPLLSDGTSKSYVYAHQVSIRNNVTRASETDGIFASGSAARYIEDLIVVGNEVFLANASLAGATTYGLRVAFFHNGRVSANHVGDQFAGATLTKISVGQRTLSIVEGNTPRSASDVTYVGALRHTTAGAVPTSGTWDLGDHIDNFNPQGGAVAFWKCKTPGTFGTLNSGNTTATVAAGSTQLTVSSASGLTGGEYITIAGVSGRKRVVGVAGTAITIDTAADASVAGAAVAYSAPAFSAGPTLV